jgi:DNA-binding NarL/FixJ family response regulator
MREAARDPGPGTGSTVAAGRTAPGGSTEAAESAPRVVIVDDHHLFRSGVRAELGAELEVVGDAGTVEAAVALIREQRPDVVLLDVHMPDGGGVEVIARLSDECQDIRFLALSVSDAAEDVIAVIRAGARGYVTKTISAAELAEAVRRVAGGDAVFSPRPASCWMRSRRTPARATLTRAARPPMSASWTS